MHITPVRYNNTRPTHTVHRSDTVKTIVSLQPAGFVQSIEWGEAERGTQIFRGDLPVQQQTLELSNSYNGSK